MHASVSSPWSIYLFFSLEKENYNFTDIILRNILFQNPIGRIICFQRLLSLDKQTEIKTKHATDYCPSQNVVNSAPHELEATQNIFSLVFLFSSQTRYDFPHPSCRTLELCVARATHSFTVSTAHVQTAFYFGRLWCPSKCSIWNSLTAGRFY